jgi:hypothetical protein
MYLVPFWPHNAGEESDAQVLIAKVLPKSLILAVVRSEEAGI